MTRPNEELILHNGRIWNAGEESSPASTVAIKDGIIVGVGGEEVFELLPNARRIDLGGHRIIPGLHDSHMHAVRAGRSWRASLHWEDIRSLQEGLEQIAARARETPPGTWISVVGGWHARQLAEGRGPTRAELDEVAPEHPVYVQMLYDEAVLNSRALRECGWGRDSEDPPRGVLERDSDSELTGRIEGVGAFSVPLQLALDVDHAESVAGTREMLQEFARHGLTGVVDGGGLLIRPEDYRPLYDLWRADQMPVRVRLYLSVWNRGDELNDVQNFTRHIHPGFGDDILQTVGAGEIVHLASHDMEGLDEFTFEDATYEEFVEISRHCIATGWPMQVHAVLDKTLTRILDAWEVVHAENDGFNGLRFAIVHGDEASDENIQRMARLGVGILSQPRLLLKATDYVEAWGAEAVRRTPPLGDYKRHGVIIGGGSDATRANWYSPWAAMWCFITGRALDDAPERDVEHRLSREEALRSYTSDAAWFTAEEAKRGRIAPGYLADLCVPSSDPLTCDIDEYLSMRSELTIMGGQITHAAGVFQSLGVAD